MQTEALWTADRKEKLIISNKCDYESLPSLLVLIFPYLFLIIILTLYCYDISRALWKEKVDLSEGSRFPRLNL